VGQGTIEWRAYSAVPSVAELQKETPAGHCVYCQRKLPEQARPVRERYVCFRADCQLEYHSAYHRWRRERFNEAGLTQRGTKPLITMAKKSRAPRSGATATLAKMVQNNAEDT